MSLSIAYYDCFLRAWRTWRDKAALKVYKTLESMKYRNLVLTKLRNLLCSFYLHSHLFLPLPEACQDELRLPPSLQPTMSETLPHLRRKKSKTKLTFLRQTRLDWTARNYKSWKPKNAFAKSKCLFVGVWCRKVQSLVWWFNLTETPKHNASNQKLAPVC